VHVDAEHVGQAVFLRSHFGFYGAEAVADRLRFGRFAFLKDVELLLDGAHAPFEVGNVSLRRPGFLSRCA
jgi:hypothetical protein